MFSSSHTYGSKQTNAASNRTGGKGTFLTDNRGQKPVAQRKPNNTGLPDNLKSGIENLSGHSMDDVKVHYNSSQPAQLNAHAYAQGNQIHLAPGQEKHLPHEAWHVVQQKQGRVRATTQLKGKVNINDDSSLEKEADVMGAKAMQLKSFSFRHIHSPATTQGVAQAKVIQRYSMANNYQITDDGRYRLNPAEPTVLFVRQGARGPHPANFFHITGAQNIANARQEQITFQRYESRSLLGPPLPIASPPIRLPDNSWHRVVTFSYAPYNGPNDCGMYATGVLRDNPAWGITRQQQVFIAPGFWMPYSTTGDSHLGLRPVATSQNDKKLKPRVGQALTINPPPNSVSGLFGTSKYPFRSNFHVAPTVITAGSDYITSEADAGHYGRAKPYWKISGSKKAGQSWHEKYNDTFKDSSAKRAQAGLNPNQVWPSTHLRQV